MLISYKITSLVLSEEPMSLHFIKTDSGIQRKHTTESSVNLSLTVIKHGQGRNKEIKHFLKFKENEIIAYSNS